MIKHCSGTSLNLEALYGPPRDLDEGFYCHPIGAGDKGLLAGLGDRLSRSVTPFPGLPVSHECVAGGTSGTLFITQQPITTSQRGYNKISDGKTLEQAQEQAEGATKMDENVKNKIASTILNDFDQLFQKWRSLTRVSCLTYPMFFTLSVFIYVGSPLILK